MAVIDFVVPENSSNRIRAVEYVRMSTEHQQYSIDNQRAKLREYAAANGIEVIRAYEDGGRSGLTIKGRVALQRLIADVDGKQTDFEIVLVYDVSRWGRFQDSDESAHYEYCCKRAGVRVIYCAEQFDNDGSPVASIVKGVKRVMAGEYSRELSVKVTAGQKRLAALGFRLGGGSRVFGFKSFLVDSEGNVKGEIQRGERKCVQNYHVVLGLGNDAEAAVVLQIFDWFVKSRIGEVEIAARLNAAGTLRTGKSWNRNAIHAALINEAYIGSSVFGKTTCRLGAKSVRNDPKDWVRVEDTHPALVSAPTFEAAKQRIAARPKIHYTREALLDSLRTTLAKHNRLNTAIVDNERGCPSSSAYFRRFGSLVAAYRLIGYVPKRECLFSRINSAIEHRFPDMSAAIGAKFENRNTSLEAMEAYSLELAQAYAAAAEVVQSSAFAPVGVRPWRPGRIGLSPS